MPSASARLMLRLCRPARETARLLAREARITYADGILRREPTRTLSGRVVCVFVFVCVLSRVE